MLENAVTHYCTETCHFVVDFIKSKAEKLPGASDTSNRLDNFLAESEGKVPKYPSYVPRMHAVEEDGVTTGLGTAA